MLPKKKRLTKAVFSDIVKEGRNIHSTNVWFKFKKIKGSGLFSASVPKKIAKTAVLRNKIRRRIYAVIEEKPDLQGVLFAKSDLSKVSFEELKNEVASLLDKASLQ